ncbi:DUF1542 domain-containing protein [Lactobacillus sp. ESL0236]|uniref:DUF1542 domain-containing protein n=1 Tax=unclassified Lactobacillus TaxID=2620435 RepID=UPI000EFA845F|nr:MULTISPECIES: DUF1542 domain-containing protein [unclassified Lactobacillus]RMC40792.1 DUF1542 domain-containing protein [Lactobacillus sp. ESL0237]RMC44548.1 DUF1542 domain-containing protein [Lactobacillus sp. ESL0234]RMC45855.1 DUF1542 domain-containing protein [Lactobacillus sp. ESL0236]
MSKNSFYKKMIISVAGAALLSVGVTESTTATNNVSAATVKSAKKVVAKTKVVGATSAVYKKAGKKVVKTKQTISAGKKVKTYGKKTIAGVAYYSIGKDQYVKAANLDGKTRQLAKSVALYARSGKVIKNSKLRKGQSVKVYGTAVTIKGKKYYSTGKGYVAVKALAKKVAEEVPNNKTNMPATDTNKPADNNKPAENTNNPSSNNTNTNNSGSSSNTGTGNTNNPVDTMKDAKAVATKAIDDAATATKTRIGKNASLTDAQKAAANKAVDAVASQAKAAINNAKTIEEIAKAQKDGVANVNAKDTTKPGDSLEDQKLMAVGVLEDAANEARLKIVSSNLSAADKAKAIDAVNKVLSEGKTAIEQGNTVEEVLQMKAQTVAKIKQQVPADTLKEAKAAAASVLDDAANEARVQITSSSLSKDDKAKAIDAVNKALSEGKVAVEQGNTVEEVLQMKAQTVAKIKQQVPADTLKEAKAAAASVLEDAANEARVQITSSSLSKDDKAKAIDAVNKALSEGKVAVEQGNTVEEVLQIKTKAVNEIRKQVPADTLKEAKAAAASVLEDAANEARLKIVSSILSDADKAKAINAINKALSEGKAAIEQGKTDKEVLQLKATAVNEIRKQVPSSTEISLEEAKATAIETIEDIAKAAKGNIGKDLPEDVLAAENKVIDDAENNAVEKINSSKSLADITAAIASGKDAINLALPKYQAESEIIGAAARAKASIGKDNVEGATAIDKVVETIKSKIAAAKSTDEISKEVESGKQAITNAEELAKIKQTAKVAIDDAVTATKERISKDIALNDAQKVEAKNAVDTVATQAKDAINNAKTAEEVAKAQKEGVDSINAKSTSISEDTLKVLKNVANAAIDNAAAAANAAIDKLTNENDKAIRKELVADAVKGAKKAIDSASNAALIESLKNTWTDTIQNLVTVSDAFKEQRTLAHDLISDIKESVLKVADKLADDKKQAAKDAINSAFTAAIAAIDKATKPAEIKSARESFFSVIDKAIPVADLQTAAIDEIKAKVDEANGNIDKSQASDIDKTDRKNLITKLGSSAEKAIKASSNVALIENAKNTWLKSIDNLGATDKDGNLVVPNELQIKKNNVENNIKDIMSIIKGVVNKTMDPAGSISTGLDSAQQIANLAIDKASKLSDIENAQSIFYKAVNALMDMFHFKKDVIDKVKSNISDLVTGLASSIDDQDYKEKITSNATNIKNDAFKELESANDLEKIITVKNQAISLIEIEQNRADVIKSINEDVKANTTGDADKIKQTAADYKSKVMKAQSVSELKALQASAKKEINPEK